MPDVSKADAAFAEFVKKHLDRKAYLDVYPDVRSAGMDPVKHWLEFGMDEGRAFSPEATIYHGDYARQVEGARWQHFTWRGRPVAVCINDQAEDTLFRAFVNEHLDRKAYLDAYPDVRSAGMDPVKHWLEYGMVEGRFLYPGAVVVLGDIAERFDETHWKHFIWRGKRVAVRNTRPIKPSLIAQIKAQAQHDPTVLAAGASALGRLRQFDGPDLLRRGGLDVRRIFNAITERPDVVVVMPHLRTGGGEKYAADLVGALSALSNDKILVIVTEDTAEIVHGWESHAMLAPLRSAHVVLWRDICGPNNQHPQVFARLFNALRPSKVVVINSRIGLDMVAGYGRGLRKYAKLYCVYFDLGMEGFDAPAGARYPSRTMSFALGLTNNLNMAATLSRQWGELPGPSVSLLPPRVEPAEESVFFRRQRARWARAEIATRVLRWVWISRTETIKGTAILAELARKRPADQFDLFGPPAGDLQEKGLVQPNIAHRGFLADLSAADFSDYDGFLFTSLFESMPNTVIEMSQHAIPMVLADVGGLRDTFDDTAVNFVQHGESPHISAEAFASALEKTARLTPEDVLAMTEATRAQALSRHAPDVYLSYVAKIFGIPTGHV